MKLAPDMKVIMRVKARMRGLCFRRAGNMGNLANFASQMAKATSKKKPRKRGTRTWAVLQEYYTILDPSVSFLLNLQGQLTW